MRVTGVMVPGNVLIMAKQNRLPRDTLGKPQLLNTHEWIPNRQNASAVTLGPKC
jgi:hypothetical protein